MALLTKFLGNYHSFHCITAPTHILGTPPLLLRYNGPNPVSSTTGYTPNMDGQGTQPSLFDHRTHPLYGRTGLYVSMSLLTKFLGNYHSFHCITAPTHIFGTPPLSLRHNEPNPVRSTTGHTPIWTDKDIRHFMHNFSGEKHSFHRITTPTHILGTPPLSLRHNEPNPVRSTTGHIP